MTATLRYSCTNLDCDFYEHLSVNVPVFRDDTPDEFRKLPVRHPEYVIAYDSDYYCIHCKMKQVVRKKPWPTTRKKTEWEKFKIRIKNSFGKKKVKVTSVDDPVRCVYCRKEDVFLHHEGTVCPECSLGSLKLKTTKF